MILTRYNNLHQFTVCREEVDVTSRKKYGPYVVDRSHFTPLSEAAKTLGKQDLLGNEVIKSAFDFPDGKAQSFELPVTRQHNFADITELSEQVRRQNATLKEAYEKAQKEKAYRDELQGQLDAIKGSSTGQSSSSNQ